MKKSSKSKNIEKKPFIFKKKRKVVEKEELDDDIREVIVERDNGFNTVEVIVIILISGISMFCNASYIGINILLGTRFSIA